MEFVPISDLKNVFGSSSNAELCAKLRQQNVKFLIGKRGQPITTWAAVHAAMGLNVSNESADENETDDVFEIEFIDD